MLKKKQTWVYLFVAAMLAYIAIRPNDWNTVYFKVEPKLYSRHIRDSLMAHGIYNYPLTPYTFFNPGNADYKKYKHGDTVPVFYKDKVVAEMNRSSKAILWSKINEIEPDTLPR